MEPEVILIEDTPPNSPIKNINNKKKIGTMQKQNEPFLPISITSDKSEKISSNCNKIDLSQNYNIYKPGVFNLTAANESKVVNSNLVNVQNGGVIIDIPKQTNIHKSENITGDLSQYSSNYTSFSTEMPIYCPPFENYTKTKNFPSYYDNFSSVKFDENYKFLTQTLIQPSFFNINNNFNMEHIPEFIDINTFMNYNNFGNTHFMTSENRLEANKINQTVESDTKSTKNNKDINSVPLFLKRNRFSIENNMKVIDLSKDEQNDKIENIEISNEDMDTNDDLEIVYVGSYAREPKYQTLPHTVYKLPNLDEEKENFDTEINRQSPISVSDSTSDNQNSQEGSSDDKNKGKWKRKPVLTVPRRNPKRQVQIEKDYLKLLDNVICESKKDAKPKKVKKTNKSSADFKKTSTNNNKKTTKQVTNVGAIYRPPSPLSIHHLREWPESGMHERPEYNNVTKILEPFDIIIRNISVNYTSQKSNKTLKNVPENSTKRKELKWICHEMFHHVLAYGATVKSFLKEDKDCDKNDIIEELDMLITNNSPLNLTKTNKIILYDSETKEDKEKINNDLKELIGNSILLYSLTNEIELDNLGKYLGSLNPEEIIDWSNKEFNLVE